MQCVRVREAISARLDGEDAPLTEAEVTAHVGVCPACHEFADRAGAFHRMVRVTAAEAVPDLASPILAAVGARRLDPPEETALRWSLVLIAFLQLVVAVPDLLGTATGICLVSTSIVDVTAGNTAALSEAQHVTDYAGLAVVRMLSRASVPGRRALPA